MIQSRWFQIVLGILAAIGIAAIVSGGVVLYGDLAYAHTLRTVGVSLDDFAFLRQARMTNERNQAQQRQASQPSPQHSVPNPAAASPTTAEQSK